MATKKLGGEKKVSEKQFRESLKRIDAARAPQAITGKNVDQREVILLAIAYAEQELGQFANVTGIIEESNGNYVVRLSSNVALMVQWSGHEWEATQELTLAAYDELANTPAVCAYCMAATTQGQLTLSVCRTCHHAGIEA